MKNPPKKMRLRLYLRRAGREARGELRRGAAPGHRACQAPRLQQPALHPPNSNTPPRTKTPPDPSPLGVEVRQLADVVGDHAAERLHHVGGVVPLQVAVLRALRGGWRERGVGRRGRVPAACVPGIDAPPPSPNAFTRGPRPPPTTRTRLPDDLAEAGGDGVGRQADARVVAAAVDVADQHVHLLVSRGQRG